MKKTLVARAQRPIVRARGAGLIFSRLLTKKSGQKFMAHNLRTTLKTTITIKNHVEDDTRREKSAHLPPWLENDDFHVFFWLFSGRKYIVRGDWAGWHAVLCESLST